MQLSIERLPIRTLILLSLIALFATNLITIYKSEQNHAFAQKQKEWNYLQKLAQRSTLQIFEQLRKEVEVFGSQFISRKEFKQNFPSNGLTEILNDPFVSGYINATTLTLESLRVYDPGWHLLAEGRTRGAMNVHEYPLPRNKSPVVVQAAQRKGTEQFKTFSGKWVTEKDALFSVILPIGGLRISGYLEVIVDASLSLRQMEQLTGYTVEIINLLTQQSILPSHPADEFIAGVHQVRYDIRADSGEPMYAVHLFVDHTEFIKQLEQNLYQALLLSGLQSLIVLFIVLALLERFLIGPLSRLRHDIHMQTLGLNDRPVPTRGVLEFHQLADDFNHLLRVLKRQSEALENLSLTDELTQLPNRRAMERFLKQASQLSLRTQQPLSVIMMDIDYFKRFNDHYGHQAGDQCLRKVARAIEEGLPRTTDFVARYGGEEFTVILPNTDNEGAILTGERIAESVRNASIPHQQSEIADHVTLSLGVATCSADNETCLESLLPLADHNLYRAKEQGRDRVVSG